MNFCNHFRMIIRIQSPDGMQRVNIDQNKSNLDLYSEVEKVTFCLSYKSQYSAENSNLKILLAFEVGQIVDAILRSPKTKNF